MPASASAWSDWPLTYPARAVNGYLVSDEYHRLDPARLTLEGTQAVTPPGLLNDVIAAAARPPDPDPTSVLVAGRRRAGTATSIRGPTRRRSRPIGCTCRCSRPSRRRHRPISSAMRLTGLDAVGHYYLRYADPDTFGDVTADEQQRFGRVLDGLLRRARRDGRDG